jgi:hypothetical protein
MHPSAHDPCARIRREHARRAREVVRRQLDVAIELHHDLVTLADLGTSALERPHHAATPSALALAVRTRCDHGYP